MTHRAGDEIICLMIYFRDTDMIAISCDCLLLLHSQAARLASPFEEKWSAVIGGFRFWSLFLESPGNYKRQKSNIQIQI